MTTKLTMITAVATVWCAATAVKCAVALMHREAYMIAWWDAAIAGTGRKLNAPRTIIKMIAMVGVSVACGLLLAGVVESSVTLYAVLGLAVVTAGAELSAPKSKPKR